MHSISISHLLPHSLSLTNWLTESLMSPSAWQVIAIGKKLTSLKSPILLSKIIDNDSIPFNPSTSSHLNSHPPSTPSTLHPFPLSFPIHPAKMKDNGERGHTGHTGLVPNTIPLNLSPYSPLTSLYPSTPHPSHLTCRDKEWKEKDATLDE